MRFPDGYKDRVGTTRVREVNRCHIHTEVSVDQESGICEVSCPTTAQVPISRRGKSRQEQGSVGEYSSGLGDL
jgi:hypothetical protein